MSFPTLVLWDIDGTLIDTTSLIVAALDHVYRKYVGSTISTEEIRAIIGTPLSEQVQFLGNPSDFGTTVASMESEFIRYYEANRDQERILTDVIALLIEGKELGHPTALITSKNHEEIKNTLPRLGILGHVDLVITADDVAKPKPDPEGILRALDHFAISGNDAVFIGDTVHDIRAGKGGGVRTCAVTWGAGSITLLRAEAPDYICSSAADLRMVLGLA